jgi:hypothetical protein
MKEKRQKANGEYIVPSTPVSSAGKAASDNNNQAKNWSKFNIAVNRRMPVCECIGVRQ